MIRIPGPQPPSGWSVFFLPLNPPGAPVNSGGGLAVAASSGQVTDGWASGTLDPHIQPLASESDVTPDLADLEAATLAQGNQATTDTGAAASLVQAQGAVTTPDVDGQLATAAGEIGRGVGSGGFGSDEPPTTGDQTQGGDDRESPI